VDSADFRGAPCCRLDGVVEVTKADQGNGQSRIGHEDQGIERIQSDGPLELTTASSNLPADVQVKPR
jgi:hypothetical protein